MNPISSDATLPLPKDRNYATLRRQRTQKVKYQTIGNVKLALNNAASAWYHSGTRKLQHIEIYKLQGNEYVKIFDSDSELANAYLDGALTYQELVAKIFE